MAKITQNPAVEVTATMSFSEAELRALDALVGYGHAAFLKVFYEKLGKHYMQPYEAGLITLFESVREVVPGILGRADDARNVFTGERVAAHRQPPPRVVPRGECAGINAAMSAKKEGE